MNFQGRLLAADGNLVPDGYYNLQFKLYTTATNGTGTNLWTETYFDANGATAGSDNRVRVVNGYFSVNLGSQTAFSGINWDQELWLTMNVGGSTQTATPTWDGEMLNATQRTKLTAVPYAFTAGQLAQSSGANRGTLSFGGATNNPDIKLPDIAGTNNVLLQSATTLFTQGSIPFTDATGRMAQDNANFFFDDTNNRLGLGTASPQATLHVNGTVRLQNFTTCTALETDASGNLVCGTDDGSNNAFIQGGNSFTAAAFLGTNDAFDLNVETSGLTRFTVEADGDIAFDTNTLFVDAASNRIGIGDVTPDATLDVELAVTSATAATSFGSLLTVADTGVVTTGTDNTYGQQINVTRTGATGGTINTYGLDIQATGDAGGTSTLIGLNVNVSGADTNYAALFNGGNVGIGTASPSGKLHVQGSDDTAQTVLFAGGADTGAAGVAGMTLTVRAGGGQTADLLQLKNSADSVIARFDSAGNLTINHGGTSSITLDEPNGAGSSAINLRGGAWSMATLRTNSNNLELFTGRTTTPTNNEFKLFVGDTSTNIQALTVLGASGNVGVGDTTPAYLFTVGAGDLSGFDSTGALGIKTGGAAATADLSFGAGNRTINVLAQTTANAAGGSLSITAGTANGSTTGNAGGALNLTGGAAAGTGNNAGGAVAIQGGAPTGTGSYGHVTIQGAGGFVGIGENAPTATLHVDGTVRFEDFVSCTALETDASGNLVCGTDDGAAGAFVQGGNSFTAAAFLGTNDAYDLNVETSGLTRFTVQADGDIAFDTNTLFVDAVNNRVGVGVAAPSARFQVGGTFTPATGSLAVTQFGGTLSGYADATVDGRGITMAPMFSPGLTVTAAQYGLLNLPSVSGSFNFGTVYGNFSRVDASSAFTGNVATGIGFNASAPSLNGCAGCSFSNYYGMLVAGQTVATNNAGIIIGEATGTAQANLVIGQTTIPSGAYSIYNSSSDQNYFAGNLGILDTTPAYAFTVGNGDLSGIDSTGSLGVKTSGETIGYDFALGQTADRTIGVNTRTTNAAGRNLTVTAGDAGAGASAFSGGQLILQGGDAAGTGNANGGAITIIGGAGVGTGTQGLVNLSTTAFTSAAVQSFGSGVNGIAAGLVDLYSTIPVNATSTAAVVSVPDPAQNTVIGRILYITARNGSTDFTLRLNASGTPIDIAMKQNSTATLIWNGDDWTAAGASSSTDLQSAYNNTLTSAGGAEIILNGPGGNADGFTIRNNAANPIVGGLLEVQSSIGTNLFSVNNYGIELAANGGAENSSTFAASWPASGGSTITRTTTAGQFVTGLAGVQVATTAAANDGVKNDLTGNPAVSTTYQVSFTAKLSSGTFSTLQVAYSRDGGTDIETCTNYSTQTLSTSVWTKITCIITTDATAPSNPQLIIRQTDATARTFWIDNLSFQRNDATTNTTPSNVQIGGGINGGPVTLLTLDRSSSPPVPNGDSTYYGSMYYDTGTGRIQCYEADGWGACGSAPDNIISLTPEYSGAVLNGTGVGTMTADFCANQSSVLVVGSLCASGLSRQFYKWTSPQANTQTYSIYVSYKLPNTFKEFISNDTITLTGLADNVTNGQVTFQVFRSSGSAITACGTETDVVATTDTANTWYTRSINGNEMTGCSFAASDTVIFKINVKAKTNASVYVENLNFTYTNR